jgi:hypothetical protein
MFKKTLLAATIVAMSTSAFAATITSGNVMAPTTGDILSRQGIEADASVAFNSGGATIALAAEYAVGDVITISISGATIDTTLTAATLVAVLPDANDTMTLGLLSTTTSTVTFRVTELTYDGLLGETTIAAVLTLAGIQLDTASVVASSAVTLTYAAKTSTDIPLDVNDTEQVISVVDQFTSSVTTKLNGVVDVNNDRQQFTVVAPDNALTDTLVFTPVDAAVLPANKAKYTGATYLVKGDFSFMDTDADGVVSPAELAAGVTVATSGDDTTVQTLNTAMSELSIAVTAVTNDTVEVVTAVLNVAGMGTGNPVLDTQSFTADSTVNYTDVADLNPSTLSTKTAEVAGSWTINGSQIVFPYAPVGYDNITTQFEIANSGSQDGEIAVDAYDTMGNVHSAILPFKAEAGKLTKIAFDDLTTAFGLTEGTKLSLTITTTAPAGDIKITGYSNLNNAGRMALLSDAYESATVVGGNSQ